MKAFRGDYANRVSLQRLRKYAKKEGGEVLNRYYKAEAKLTELHINDVFNGLCKRLMAGGNVSTTLSKHIDESTLRAALMNDPHMPQLTEERHMRESLLQFLMFIRDLT